jgi:hypothetical protein
MRPGANGSARAWAIALAIIGSACFLVRAEGAEQPPAAAKPQRDLTAQEREQLYLVEVVAWAKKTGANSDQVFQKVMEPIYAGSQYDREWNRKMAATFSDRAVQAKKNGQEQSAKNLAAVAELFAACGRENDNVLAAIKSRDTAGLKSATDNLRRYDARIESISGEKLNRKWAVIEDMFAPAGADGQGTDKRIAPQGAKK